MRRNQFVQGCINFKNIQMPQRNYGPAQSHHNQSRYELVNMQLMFKRDGEITQNKYCNNEYFHVQIICTKYNNLN